MIPLYQELPFTSNSYINFYKEDLPHFIVPWHYHPEIEIMAHPIFLGGTFINFLGISIATIIVLYRLGS